MRLSGVRGQGVSEQGNSTGVLNILGVRPVSRILCTTYHIVMYSHNIHIYTTIGCEPVFHTGVPGTQLYDVVQLE